MALITGGLERILIKYPEFDLSKIRLVGWGAGQYFKYHYPLIKKNLPLEYTVCPNQENHGKTLNGIKIYSPEVLLNESKEHTVVVIFAEKFFDVMHALRDQFNNLHCIRACQLIADEGLYQEIQDFQNLNIQPLERKWKNAPKFGIFVQGMATKETPFVLAWNRLHHPHAYQCMATWENLDVELLEKCRPWLDKLILAPQPENIGHLYINSGQRSARLGIEHLATQGIEYAVRTRTDCILRGSVRKVIERHFQHNINRGKFIIPMFDSWPQIPFMFGEKVMVARTQDMLDFWSMPEDKRPPDHPEFKISYSENFQKLRHTVPESIWWTNYAQRCGFPTATFEDSFNFLRSKILPIEPDLTSISLKFTPLFNISAHYSLQHTHETLKEVYTNPELYYKRINSIQNLEMTVGDFWDRKIG
jgi:hypothetical protein